MNNKNLLLKVLEAGRSKIKVPADSVSGEDPLPGVCVCVSGEDPLPGGCVWCM